MGALIGISSLLVAELPTCDQLPEAFMASVLRKSVWPKIRSQALWRQLTGLLFPSENLVEGRRSHSAPTDRQSETATNVPSGGRLPFVVG
jgi:hypothetical protein